MDEKELINNIKNRQNQIKGREFKVHLEPCDECKKRGKKDPIQKKIKENKIKFI